MSNDDEAPLSRWVPSSYLRWREPGVLEQKWYLKTPDDAPIETREEWRPVPSQK